ncbi:hypothetical protein EVAR_36564_1 [Eumeta japonica]|uniref:Uncharacterized protein n=1 Tax=Eumeta variegata TaxID=151549 RepID=A0A4C1Y1X4_EUMVA|nr:hypothetical protein EVAR_36564_1 [Eumeta japonica]
MGPIRETGKILITSLELQMSMGNDDPRLSGDSHTRLPLENATKKTDLNFNIHKRRLRNRLHVNRSATQSYHSLSELQDGDGTVGKRFANESKITKYDTNHDHDQLVWNMNEIKPPTPYLGEALSLLSL